MVILEYHEVLILIILHNLLVFNWAIFPQTNFVDEILPHNLVNVPAVV